ncbi:MAG: hypothetical protein P8Q36_02005, partial [Alphaproteobacteria bacterium]|nr:hypothetical protein [Alphaproteobacteria bacterium]
MKVSAEARARRRANLKRLLNARSVALIGGRIMAISLAYGKGLGYDGDLYLINPRHEEINGFRCHASLDDLPVTPDAAVVGVTAQTLVLNDRDLPVGYMLSLGNQAGVDICDGIDVALDDPRVSAVGLYIEGLDDVSAFEVVARRAIEKGVPLVVYKAGVSEKGAAAIRSHTASLAGEDRFFDALFARHGVIRTPSLPALIETLKLLTVSGPPPGPGLGVLTVSGADCSIVNDVAERHGVTLPPPDPERSVALDGYLGGLGKAVNPYDFSVGTWRDPEAQMRCFSDFAKAGFDSVMLMSSYPLHSPWSSPQNWDHGVDALIAAKRETCIHASYAVSLVETIPDYARALDRGRGHAIAGARGGHGVLCARKPLP